MNLRKKLLTCIIALAAVIICFVVLPADAQAASVADLDFELNSDGASYSVTYCNESASGELVIPATYNGKPVTSIGSDAFICCYRLTGITIPESVTTISEFAFFDCDSLTDVYYTGTQEQWNAIEIDYYGNDDLTNATIVYNYGNEALNYLTFKLNSDGASYCVTDCNESASGELVIPATYNGKPVTAIGNYAFEDCTSLTSITIPDSVTTIGEYAFRGCILTSIAIPDSVTTIGDSAFGYCYRLTSVTIGNSVTSIGDYAFCVTSLTSITIPDSVTTIGDYAFFDCCSLTSVTLGNGVTTIGSHAFYGCILTSITIPDSVTTIGNSAFYWCDSLTSITIPDSVTTIGDSAFSYCRSLADVYYTGTPEQWNAITIGIYNDCLWDATIVYNYGNEALNYLTFKLNSDGASYRVTDCNESASGELVIPATYNGKPVTAIGNYAFEDCTSLTSITIPNSVTSIGDYAFCYCDRLTSITIPNSVTTIGEGAFENCDSLTSITIPNSVTTIGYGAFENCDSLTNITIPDSVTSIGDYAFCNCDSLTSITIPDSVTTIGYGAFENCDSLTNITIPDSVTSIGDYAFCNCDSLTSITIPDSVTSIGDNAFYDCISLTSITIPDSVTTIGSYAFYDCINLTSITIPNSVTTIGEGAFYWCTSLETVYYKGTQEQWNAITIASFNGDLRNATIVYNYSNEALNYLTFELNSDGASYSITDCNESASGELVIPATYNGKPVTTIGAYAFEDCTSLTSITIPDSVTYIGEYAFYNCSSLTQVHISDIGVWCKINFSSFYSNPLFYAKNLYINGEKLTDVVLSDSVTAIGNYTFLGCTNLTSVTIPDSVTRIGIHAFQNCTALSKVTIGNGLTTIGSYAFRNCISLTSITIPDSVTTIGSYAFYNCKSLTSVTIGNSVTTIGSYAFYDCTSLTSITIPDSVTTIGGGAFHNCTGLTSITIPDSVTTVGESVFAYCANLTSVTIGKSVTAISDYMFYNCNRLENIVIPDGITAIGVGAFRDCNHLESIMIPDSVTAIGEGAFRACNYLEIVNLSGVTTIEPYAFWDCYHLTELVISDNLVSIGDYAFYNCQLKNFTFPDSVTTIGEFAFEKCTSLTSVTIGNGVTFIGKSAFYDCTRLENVYYKGTQEQWNAIEIVYDNDALTDATIFYNYGHAHNYDAVVTAPTCTTAGYTTYTCSICGDTYIADETAAGHNFDRQIKDIKYRKSGATINSPAIFYKVCVCGLSSKGHTDETFEYGDRLGGAAASVCKDDKYTYYVTVEEAIAAAIENGGVVELQKNMDTAKPLTITGDVTIDFGGFTYTVMDPTKGTQDCPVAVVIENGANVTLKNGRLQIRYNRRHLFNYLIENNGVLTTENITLRGGNVYAPGATATILNTGALNLKAGTIVEIRVHALSTTNANVIKDASVEMKPAVGYCWLADQSTLTAHIFDQQAIANHLRISGATTTSPAIFYKSCACGESSKGYSNEATFTYGMPIGSFEAKIGDVYYATIADAIAVAGEDDVIEVLKTITQGKKLEITRNVTIDFCGFTYSVGVSGEEIGAAIIVAEGVEATLRNGAVQIRYSERMSFNALIQNGGLLRVDNITMKASNACAAGAEAIKGNALTIGENVTVVEP